MHRFLLPSLLVLVLTGCASMEYKDNRAEVAQDPRCLDKPAVPGQKPAPWCQGEAGTSWSSKRKDKIDFSGKNE